MERSAPTRCARCGNSSPDDPAANRRPRGEVQGSPASRRLRAIALLRSPDPATEEPRLTKSNATPQKNALPKRLFGRRGLGQAQCFVRCYYRQIRTKPDSARFPLGLARCTRQHSDGHENDREGDSRRPALVAARTEQGHGELPRLSCVARAACMNAWLSGCSLEAGIVPECSTGR